MQALHLSTLSRRINFLLLYTDCRGGRTAAIECHVSFTLITYTFLFNAQSWHITVGYDGFFYIYK